MRKTKQAEEISEIRELLRRAGLRSTTARLAVVQRLRRADAPLTHGEIAEELVPLGFDKATVFRNLSDLTESGLVRRSELGGHVWRFELVDQNDPESARHPHFVCVDCGMVTCLSDTELSPAYRKAWSRVGRVTEILLKGHCARCEPAAS